MRLFVQRLSEERAGGVIVKIEPIASGGRKLAASVRPDGWPRPAPTASNRAHWN